MTPFRKGWRRWKKFVFVSTEAVKNEGGAILKGISPVVGPDLLATLCRMGHGDEIVIADAHFPAESLGPSVIRMDGVGIDQILRGIMPLLVLDQYDENAVVMMDVVSGDTTDKSVETGYLEIINEHETIPRRVAKIGRFDFYARAKNAFTLVVSGDTRKYANLLLKKGVTTI